MPPLVPLNRETGKPKTEDELSAGEKAGRATEVTLDREATVARKRREAQSDALLNAGRGKSDKGE